jgi:uncharacterized damage-inducible protein DinB
MSSHLPDPTLDRLLRHMAWANADVLARLRGLPDEALGLAAPGSEWTVAQIAEHLVMGAGGYASRLDGEPWPPEDTTPPEVAGDVEALAALCVGYDARLRAAATVPEGETVYQIEDRTIRRARSTILGQSIHHATEHRAQIAGALAAHGIAAVDLDAIDVWAYSEAEGLGA